MWTVRPDLGGNLMCIRFACSLNALCIWCDSFFCMCPQTNLPIFKLKESSVRRRYSDFEWLRAELERESKVRLSRVCSSVSPLQQFIQDYSFTKCKVTEFCCAKQIIHFVGAGGGPAPPWKSSDPTAPLPRRRRDIWWWVHRGPKKGLGAVSQQVRPPLPSPPPPPSLRLHSTHSKTSNLLMFLSFLCRRSAQGLFLIISCRLQNSAQNKVSPTVLLSQFSLPVWQLARRKRVTAKRDWSCTASLT